MMGIRGLACVVAESTDLPRWKAYAEGVLSMMTSSAPKAAASAPGLTSKN